MSLHRRIPLRERFESKYIPEPNSGCWLWTDSWTPAGYGIISLGGRRGKKTGAHRAAYELYVGPIPEGLDILHRCDTPCCVNPDHLYPGTDFQNRKDMVDRGRAVKSRQGLPWGVNFDGRVRKRQYFAQFSLRNRKYRHGSGFATPQEAHKFAVAWRKEVLTGGGN